MAYEGFESARDNIGKFIYQLQLQNTCQETSKDPNKII